MGFNTTVLIYNDMLGSIEIDPLFGRNLAAAIRERATARPGRMWSVGGSVAEVVETHHADDTALVAVGGNYATVLGMAGGGREHHTPDGQLMVLRAVARQMGYDLVPRAPAPPAVAPVAKAVAKKAAKKAAPKKANKKSAGKPTPRPSKQ